MLGGIQGLNMSMQYGNSYQVCKKKDCSNYKKKKQNKKNKKYKKCLKDNNNCTTQWMPNTVLGAVG